MGFPGAQTGGRVLYSKSGYIYKYIILLYNIFYNNELGTVGTGVFSVTRDVAEIILHTFLNIMKGRCPGCPRCPAFNFNRLGGAQELFLRCPGCPN
jgi:hypothetical protein